MTRAEQPTVVNPAPDDALVADSRERAVRALLRFRPLKQLWSAQLVGGVGDVLALFVLVVLAFQTSLAQGAFGGGYQGAAFTVSAVLGVRVLATLLFGAVLLGPVSSLTAPGGPLDRRWTMVVADGLRAALLIVAPLWIDWTPDTALATLLVTVFVLGVAERFWTVCRESAAPALLPAPAGRRGRRAPPAGPLRRPAPALPAHHLRRGAAGRRRAGRGHPGGEPAGHRHRLVRHPPGRARLVRRGRPLRRLALRRLLPDAARHPHAARPLPARGAAPPEDGQPAPTGAAPVPSACWSSAVPRSPPPSPALSPSP